MEIYDGRRHGQDDVVLLDEEQVELGRARTVHGPHEDVLEGQTVRGRRFDENARVRRRFRVEEQRVAGVVEHACLIGGRGEKEKE